MIWLIALLCTFLEIDDNHYAILILQQESQGASNKMASNSSPSHLCVLCGEKLETKALLQEHFRKHANNQIGSKGKSEQKGNRKRKIECITSSKEIKCDACDATFEDLSLALTHKFRKHRDSNERYYCPMCGKNFPLKTCREAHMKTHAFEKPEGIFSCGGCAEEFFSTGALDYHVKTVHRWDHRLIPQVIPPPPSKKVKVDNAGDLHMVYYCHLCGCEYMIKYNLQKHLRNSHSSEERDVQPSTIIKCRVCDAIFYSKKAYKTHTVHHSPLDMYISDGATRFLQMRVDADFDPKRVVPGQGRNWLHFLANQNAT
ncbi:unnamed protein product [Darwinula stevensoni]|uniref:C2H2-type domain-containing protein n=1 Tax=Darwinula stevensoni TaxID=69355 RepID=A0A7R9A474_9CRUS|nr:unnamed protein product [Darwinula stevensoni]CAG0883715.1 unnamed protein product [Darwinula stevensoni]